MRISSQQFEALLIKASDLPQCRLSEVAGAQDSTDHNTNNCEELSESRSKPFEQNLKVRIAWGPDPNEPL
jgi:hypothetical protein